MDAIALYSSSDEDETSLKLGPANDPSPQQPYSQLLPSAEALFVDPSVSANVEDPHHGRVRSFPHVEGNYATHVFIDVHPPPTCTAPLRRLLAALQQAVGDVQPIEEESSAAEGSSGIDIGFSGTAGHATPAALSYHLSLSRTAPVRQAQIDSLIATLRQRLRRLEPFTLSMATEAEVFVNDDRTRSFVALTAASSQEMPFTARIGTQPLYECSNKSDDVLIRAINAVSAAFKLHGLPGYYENPRPHVSIAWCLGDKAAALEAALVRPAAAAALEELRVARWTCRPRAIVCKIGKKRFTVWEAP